LEARLNNVMVDEGESHSIMTICIHRAHRNTTMQQKLDCGCTVLYTHWWWWNTAHTLDAHPL